MRASPLLAPAAGAAVILSAAYLGDVRAAILRTWPGHYRYVIGAIVAASVAAALVLAVRRIRPPRAPRLAALAAAVCGAAAYSAAFRTGNPDIDVVEAFHFVEYGLLATVFSVLWRRHADARRLALPLLAGVAVGIFDEWLQWYVPDRVGEARDVALNGAAVCFGLLFGLAVDPAARSAFALPRRAVRQVGGAAAGVAVLFALFLVTVHTAYEIRDREFGSFRSRYSAEALQEIAVDRAAAWQGELPIYSSRFAREDHYLTEGLRHVQLRNDAVAHGDAAAAWRENLILERFYGPVLRAGHAWSPAQRAGVEQRNQSIQPPPTTTSPS